MNRMIAWFASNHVAANLLMLFCIIGGIMTALSIKVEVFPETSLDRILVSVSYPGASPAEVEESVVRRIEEKLAGLAGVRKINSRSREGRGSVTIEVLQNWDLDKLLDEVKAEVDRLTSLPEEAEQPVVREVTRRSQVVWVGLYGDVPEATLKTLAEEMQDEITNLPGVTLTELSGVRPGEIHVEIDEQTLRRYGLTLGQVSQAIARASLDLPAGSIKTKGSEILVRAKGRRYQAAEYADIPVITQTGGKQITLGHIANLRDGFVESDIYARMQGKPAILVRVYRVADQNALDVAGKVHDYVAKKKASLPQGVGINFFGDASQVLESRLDLLIRNMGVGLLLVVLVLWAFLEWRLSFWVALGIPISFCIGVWMLPPADVSINMISLFAFILVLGIVVDDAIVVGENIFKNARPACPACRPPSRDQGSGRSGHFCGFDYLGGLCAPVDGLGHDGKVDAQYPHRGDSGAIGFFGGIFVHPARPLGPQQTALCERRPEGKAKNHLPLAQDLHKRTL
jgi:multidrug efflux pump subunit AcrB